LVAPVGGGGTGLAGGWPELAPPGLWAAGIHRCGARGSRLWTTSGRIGTKSAQTRHWFAATVREGFSTPPWVGVRILGGGAESGPGAGRPRRDSVLREAPVG